MNIYELIDYSNDEMYYPLALFLSLEDAIAEIKKGSKPPSAEVTDDNEDIILCIREREIGSFDEGGKIIRRSEWISEYDEESDSYIWKEQVLSE